MANRSVSSPRQPLLRLLSLTFLLIVVWVQPTFSAPELSNGQEFLALVEADVNDGLITTEESLLYRFQYGFSPQDLPSRYEVTNFSPLRCGTTLIHEYFRERSHLSPRTIRQIEAWLQPKTDKTTTKLSVMSPSGRFSFTYEISGADAVPTADIDPANGVPDYVDHVAVAFDETWTVEIENTGFNAPPLNGGIYEVTFESMQFYGYTSIVNVAARRTRIVLHNSYVGFPGNDDPDGVVAGASRATAAHEFKHASQFATTAWAEGGWSELDATWAEELVFDQVNDYDNYLIGESPIRRPELPLDGGSNSTGSYEDCVWQLWLSESFGPAIIQEFWQLRSSQSGESVMTSYSAVLKSHGVSMPNAWAAFTAWNYAVAERALPGIGYEEAYRYPAGPLHDMAMTFPYQGSGSVEHLAADFVGLSGFSANTDDIVRVVFEGEQGAGPLTLSIVTKRRNGSGTLEIVPLAGDNTATYTLETPVSEIISVGLIVGNAATSGLSAAWTMAVDLIPIPVLPNLVLDQMSVATMVKQNEIERAVLQLVNAGQAGSVLDYELQIWTLDPADLNVADTYSNTHGNTYSNMYSNMYSNDGVVSKSVAGSTVSLTASSYLPGALLNLNFMVYNDSPDDEWISDLTLDFPAGVRVLVSSDFVGGTRGDMMSDNSLGDGALVSWHGVFGPQNYRSEERRVGKECRSRWSPYH